MLSSGLGDTKKPGSNEPFGKNVNENVQDVDGVTLIHLDHLSQITDETLENRKLHIPQAEAIIEEIKEENVKDTNKLYIIWYTFRSTS